MHKENILRDQKDFVLVYNKGKSQGSKYVVVLFRKNRKDHNRIAFVASKKVGNSVRRNRARRLMKEAYRTVSDQMKPGYDIILVARKEIDQVKEEEVLRSVRSALVRASLLEKGQSNEVR